VHGWVGWSRLYVVKTVVVKGRARGLEGAPHMIGSELETGCIHCSARRVENLIFLCRICRPAHPHHARHAHVDAHRLAQDQ